MELPLSRSVVPSIEWRERSASTNSELVARAAELDDLTVLATADQHAGRGRLDRVWSAAPGDALAVSVFVAHGPGIAPSTAHDTAPVAPPDPRRLGWLPLVTGLAVVRAAHSLGVTTAGLKWPNDVLVERAGSARKLCGVLAELTPRGVVIGAGINLGQSAETLPVPTATSLAIEGVDIDRRSPDVVLAAVLEQLVPLIGQWRASTDPWSLRDQVSAVLQTRGRAVRVDLPGQPMLLGTAIGLDDDGRLLVQPRDTAERLVAVAAGDVTHLRYE